MIKVILFWIWPRNWMTHHETVWHYSIIIISCHQTIFLHRFVHARAVSLNSRRSSKVQGCARCEHCNMWDVLSAASPHSHVVSPFKYPHFFFCSLLQVYPVLSLFRHLHFSQVLSCPVTRSSYRLTKPACAFSSSLLFHLLTRTTFAGKWTGWTLVRRLLLDNITQWQCISPSLRRKC